MTEAVLAPLKVMAPPAMNSEFATSWVEATKEPPVTTVPVGPMVTPLGLTRNRLPEAESDPSICEAEKPVTRLSVAPLPFSNRTEFPAPTEKPPQLMTALREDWVTRTLVAEGEEMLADPAATTGALGKALWARAARPDAKNATLASRREATVMRREFAKVRSLVAKIQPYPPTCTGKLRKRRDGFMIPFSTDNF